MSDARWIEIDRAVASAVRNFRQGVEFAHHADFTVGDLIGAALPVFVGITVWVPLCTSVLLTDGMRLSIHDI